MEATGTNGRQLIALLKAQEGRVISEGHLSNVLKGSRRCSLGLALSLHEVTNVSIKTIAKWPHIREIQTSQAVA